MEYDYSDKPVTPWGGMLQMKELIDRSGISGKLTEIGLPQSKSNNSLPAIDIIRYYRSILGKCLDRSFSF